MASNKLSFSVDIDSIKKGLELFASKSDAAITMYAESSALVLQNYARDHAPWTDRTGHARQRLTGSQMRVTKGYQLKLAHGVDYGIWLELAHEKRFAIIQPTILAKSNEIMQGFERLLDKIK